MKNKIYVHKIGGAGLMLSSDDMTNLVLKILDKSKGGTVIFVVSALAGVTRLLGEIFKAVEYRQKKEIESLLKKFGVMHSEMIERLTGVNPVDFKKSTCSIENELRSFVYDHVGVPTQKYHAQILSYGELYSSFIFACFIDGIMGDCEFLDARNFIIGNGPDYLNAEPVLNLTASKIIQNFSRTKGAIVTQGYIASNSNDESEGMVLGYDGSDLTAALITYALLQNSQKTISLVYWKDIPGVFMNPLIKEEGIFSLMKIREYLDFSSKNSVPVRSDAIKLLSGEYPNLKISIRSFKKLEELGTTIKP